MSLAIAQSDPPSAAPPDPLLSVDRAASYVGLSAAYLNKMRTQGGGPVFHKVGVRVLYRISDLDDWLSDKRRTSTADDGRNGVRDATPDSVRAAVR
jgi:Helix-turn-helix domain